MSSIMGLDALVRRDWDRALEAAKASAYQKTGPCDHIPSVIDICPPGAKCQFNWKPNPEHQACVAALARPADADPFKSEADPEPTLVPKEGGIPGWVWAVAGASVVILLVRR